MKTNSSAGIWFCSADCKGYGIKQFILWSAGYSGAAFDTRAAALMSLLWVVLQVSRSACPLLQDLCAGPKYTVHALTKDRWAVSLGRTTKSQSNDKVLIWKWEFYRSIAKTACQASLKWCVRHIIHRWEEHFTTSICEDDPCSLNTFIYLQFKAG